jgi:amidohydrolase
MPTNRPQRHARATTTDLKADVAATRDRLVELRRHFHMHPELAMAEHATAGRIAEELRRAGLDVREGVGGTGVVGLLRGDHPGRVLLVRADIDALPIEERTGAEYASCTPGLMHACGHDGHIAIGLVMAEILAARRAELHGTVKFAFQPAEEQVAGASAMIAAGVLRDPAPDAVIGLHLSSKLPVGQVGVQDGPCLASVDSITLRVRGRGGHGAVPQLNIDPILAAAEIVVAAQTLVSREISPFNPAVVTFGMIHGGTAGNIIADEVQLGGTLRAYSADDRAHLVRRLGELAAHVATALRATAELEISGGTPACINDAAMAELMRRAVVATVGADHLTSRNPLGSASDDMALFLEAVPGCYCFVGAGNVARGIDATHHSNHFDIDEDALPIGVELMARATLEYLGG